MRKQKPCPKCGEREEVHYIESIDQYLCNDCNMAFEGTAAEYGEWEHRRLHHRGEHRFHQEEANHVG